MKKKFTKKLKLNKKTISSLNEMELREFKGGSYNCPGCPVTSNATYTCPPDDGGGGGGATSYDCDWTDTCGTVSVFSCRGTKPC